MNYPGFRNLPNLDRNDLLIFYHKPPQDRPVGAVVSPGIFKISFFMRIKKNWQLRQGFSANF
jgi:hypothetical protein